MTEQQYEIFRKEFKTIVYNKGVVTNHIGYIKKLHGWDKNGSHKNAILKSLERKKELENNFTALLKGKTYAEWLLMSKKLSALKSRLKQSVNRKQAIQQKINAVIFEPIKKQAP